MTQPIAYSPSLIRGAPAQTWGQTIRNVLTGKISANWQHTLYRSITVLHVIALAYSFFNGYLILSLVFVLSIGLDALAQRMLKDLGTHKDLNFQYMKENGIHKLNNIAYAMNNKEFKKSLGEFEKLLSTMEDENKVLHGENEIFKKNNKMYSALLNEWEESIQYNREQLENLIKQGKITNNEAARVFKKGSKDLEAQIKNGKKLFAQFERQTDDVIKQFTSVLKEANEGTLKSVDKLVEVQSQVAAAVKELEMLKTQIARFEKENEKYEKLNKELKKSVGVINRFFNWWSPPSTKAPNTAVQA